MAAFGSVLVPLDGSPLAEQALSAAISLGRRAGSTLHLAMVHEPIPTWAHSASIAAIIAESESRTRAAEVEYLDRLSAELISKWSVNTTTALLEGPIVEALERHGATVTAELVVMTTHGRGGLARQWLGSVADQLVRRLSTPVLLMRPTEDTRRPVTDSVFRRILIPLDGSKRAEAALEAALAIGGLSDAEYVLLRVERPTLPDELYLPRRDSPEIKETSLLGRDIEARRYLGEVTARFGELAASVSTEVRVARSPAAEILREAEVLGPDLIALATRGMVGVERFWLGSVTDKVLRGTNVPVLIVRAPDKVQEDAPADGRE